MLGTKVGPVKGLYQEQGAIGGGASNRYINSNFPGLAAAAAPLGGVRPQPPYQPVTKRPLNIIIPTLEPKSVQSTKSR